MIKVWLSSSQYLLYILRFYYQAKMSFVFKTWRNYLIAIWPSILVFISTNIWQIQKYDKYGYVCIWLSLRTTNFQHISMRSINVTTLGVLLALCYSVLRLVGITQAQGVQQNVVDFSKAVPNAQGLYFYNIIPPPP